MAILKNCEIHFVRLDPKRPNSKYNKKQPTWELQIRTRSKEVRKHWESLNLKPKIVEPEDDSPIYYRVNLRKKSIKASGEAADPVVVVNGSLMPIDPNTIGNGSIANIRIFQYDYENDGEKGIATVLMSLQITKHIVYVPKPRDDDFEMVETEVVQAAVQEDGDCGPDEDDGTDDIPFDGGKPASTPRPKSPVLDPSGDY